MKFLITGGAGYIGSTICSALEDAGHTPVILDSLITGRVEFTRNRIFYHGDIADTALVERLFSEHPDIYATVHCAALIVVPESVSRSMYTSGLSIRKVLKPARRITSSRSALVFMRMVSTDLMRKGSAG